MGNSKSNVSSFELLVKETCENKEPIEYFSEKMVEEFATLMLASLPVLLVFMFQATTIAFCFKRYFLKKFIQK